MPTDFTSNSIDLSTKETETETVSNAPQEKFDASKWMLAITAIVNSYGSRLDRLERSNFFLRLMVVIQLGLITYIWR